MIPVNRVLDKLDSLLAGNDYAAAKRLLTYWLGEAECTGDSKGAMLMKNELMGLCRKLGEREEAVSYAKSALEMVEKLDIDNTVTAATIYLNSATVYKAFGMAEDAIALFQKAREIYEGELPSTDERLAGLYNNMGLALVDLKRFEQANELYKKAIAVLENLQGKEPEQAITYLNMATAAETKEGLNGARPQISELAKKAMACLDVGKDRTDGNYAFVCEKCVSVFGYYGYEEYAAQLKERSRRIYEGS